MNCNFNKLGLLILFYVISSCTGKHKNCFNSNSLKIEITAENYEWFIRYPGVDNLLHTSDDLLAVHDFRLPVNTDISLELTSKDNLHFFSIPELNLIETAAPKLKHNLQFIVFKPSEYDIEAVQMCGFPHETLHSKVTFESPCKFQYWLSNETQEVSLIK